MDLHNDQLLSRGIDRCALLLDLQRCSAAALCPVESCICECLRPPPPGLRAGWVVGWLLLRDEASADALP